MQRVGLGDCGIEVSRLILGCAPIGGLYERVTEEEARATVAAAWASGVRTFDTAPLYGYGLSERRLGAALAGRPRAEVVVSTKVGRVLVPRSEEARGEEAQLWPAAPAVEPVFDFTRDGVRRSLEASLERLGLEHVDIALLHDPDEHMDLAIGEAVPALVELRAEGLLRAIGAGMNQARALARLVREADLDCILLAGRYTLLDQSAALDLLPACAERGVAVLAGAVFNSGVLAAPSAQARYDYQPAPRAIVERAHRIADVCRRHDVPLAAAAMAFPLRHPAVRAIVVGARSPAEVATDVRLFARRVPAALWDELQAEGLLRAGPAEGVRAAP